MYAKGGQGVGAMSPLTPPPSASDTPSTAASDDSPCSHTAAARRSGSPYPRRERLPSWRGPAGHGDFGGPAPEAPPPGPPPHRRGPVAGSPSQRSKSSSVLGMKPQ